MTLKCIKYTHLLIQFITILSNSIFLYYVIIIIIIRALKSILCTVGSIVKKWPKNNVNIFNEL